MSNHSADLYELFSTEKRNKNKQKTGYCKNDVKNNPWFSNLKSMKLQINDQRESDKQLRKKKVKYKNPLFVVIASCIQIAMCHG